MGFILIDFNGRMSQENRNMTSVKFRGSRVNYSRPRPFAGPESCQKVVPNPSF
jgi:hypothetical protein